MALSDDDRRAFEFVEAYFAIHGAEELDSLISLLRDGRLPSRLQKMLAEALDPVGKSICYFERRDRHRGRGAAKRWRDMAAKGKRMAIFSAYEKAAGEDLSLKLEALVSALAAHFKVSRATVFNAIKEGKEKQG